MKRVVVSAPGKIHLMGEHAVVYGKPALLAAVNRRLTVTIGDQKDTGSGPSYSSRSHNLAGQAIAFLEKTFSSGSGHPLHITITSDILPGFHLGSSAALAVALSGAFLQFHTGTFIPDEINTLAYEIEKIAHGMPSGGDNTAITYGGFLLFTKTDKQKKTYTPFTPSQLSFMEDFSLINTGKPESTKAMVAHVRALVEKYPDKLQKAFDQNQDATLLVQKAILQSDPALLLEGIRLGQSSLETMGVVSDSAKRLIHTIEGAGGAAKILGGGGLQDGVGYILCYHTNKKQIEHAVSSFGYAVESIKLGEKGVRIEI